MQLQSRCGGLNFKIVQVTTHLYRYAVRGYSYLVSVTEPAGTLSTKFSTDQSTALDLTAKFNRRF